MPTQACLNNIAAKGGVFCGQPFCDPIQTDINEYCKHTGLGGDVPVPQNNGGKKCYCCCSCFAYNTPIQVAPSQFRLVQDLKIGDPVMVTGIDATNWETKDITDAAGIAPGVMMEFMYYTAARLDDSGEDRYLITTADHLFVLLEGPEHRLIPAQDLRPGFKVLTANGGAATIAFSVVGQFTGGVRSISVGEYEGGPLDGHMLNSNGIVTADFSVQSWYYSGELSSALLTGDPDTPFPGSAAYAARYQSDELLAFLADETLWPTAFKPVPTSSLINIPVAASRFFTQAQSQDIANNVKMAPYGNNYRLAMQAWLFQVYRGFYPDINFVIDWQNELPNGFYFKDFDEDYVVITGGMVRLDPVGTDALAIVISHLLANRMGYKCVGEADYYGIFYFLREVWFSEKFFDVYFAGMDQLDKVFAGISPDHAGGDPNNVCLYPSIPCRKKALEAASGMQGVPACATPKPPFVVSSATPNPALTQVVVAFSRDLDVPSATSTDNYRFRPNCTVTGATMSAGTLKSVVLTVTGLLPVSAYEVLVRDVVDVEGNQISRVGNRAHFTTP